MGAVPIMISANLHMVLRIFTNPDLLAEEIWDPVLGVMEVSRTNNLVVWGIIMEWAKDSEVTVDHKDLIQDSIKDLMEISRRVPQVEFHRCVSFFPCQVPVNG